MSFGDNIKVLNNLHFTDHKKLVKTRVKEKMEEDKDDDDNKE